MSQNFLLKDREAIRTPVVHVRKQPQHYVTNLINTILSVMSDFITEQRISAIDFNPLLIIFIARKMTKSFIFRVIYNTKFSEIRRFN